MKKRMRSVICLLLIGVMLLGLAACKKSNEIDTGTEADKDEKVTYTVRVLNSGGVALANVGVYIYEDETKQELVWYNNTNEAGEMTFEDVKKDTYVAVLADVPTGYKVEDYYPLTDLVTEIRLGAGVMTGDEEIVYKLGDMVLDFTITDTDGKEHNLYKLLEQKQAVILNFYYNGCVPCQQEFPFLQEAYEMYGDLVEVIAMNHTDSPEEIAAFKAEYGLTFPFAHCEENWKNIMDVDMYPTTIVIDRFGNIVLMHTGGIESAQQVKDLMAAVTGEEYEQKIYKSIQEIETTAEEGSAENPSLMGATPRFELTIEGGKEHYIEFLKLNNLTMQIKDPDAYVMYNGKKYVPDNKGVITLLVDCPDMNTAVKIGFGNSSKETKKFVVTMSAQPGSLDNPYKLSLGENQVNIAKGNDQGVYYTWTATENGTLKASCIKASAGVQYDCVLYNLTSYAQRNMGVDGKTDENGRRFVEVKVNKGDKVQMIAAVLPDESWNYPGGSFTYLVEFTKGDGREDNKTKQTEFTVTVTDDKGDPMANVKFSTTLDEEPVNFSTNSEGVASVKLPEGSYQVSMIVPDGYTAEKTEFLLTTEAPACTVKLAKKVIVMADYTVTVKNADEEPLANVTVVIGSKFGTTDANGKVVMNMEKGAYNAVITAPEGYVVLDSYAFQENATELTVVLEYALGTEKNPIDIYEMEVTTDPIAAGKGLYYNLYRLSGLILTVNDADAKITIGDRVYIADENGKVVLTVPASGGTTTPVLMKLENTGAETELYTIVLEYPLGHRMNPEVLESLGELTTDLTVGSTGGYYYSWTTAEEGVVTFYLKSAPANVAYDLVLTNTTNSVVRLLSENGEGGFVTLNVSAGDTILINPTVMGTVKEPVQFVSVGSFTAQENTDDMKYTYSVIVKDAEGNPMENVAVTIGNTQLTTDENGMAFAQLVEGTYTAKITVPAGYKASSTQASLNAVENQAQFTLTAVTMVDYTVNITLDGAAYTGQTKVQILENGTPVFEKIVTTGTVNVTLAEGNYTVKLTMLEDNKLLYNAETAKLTTAAPRLIIELTRPKTYTDYKITVVDANNKAQSGILVQIMNGNTVVASGNTDNNGQFTSNLETGNYTVELKFSGTNHYYNKQTAVLSGNMASLTIRLASELDTSKYDTHWLVNDEKIYKVGEGITHVQIGAGKPYSHAGGDYSDCLFYFVPTRLGLYTITVDYKGGEVRSYSDFVGSVMDQSSNYDDGIFYLDYKYQDQLNNEIPVIFGIENVDGVTDACITITRVGEAGFDMGNLPVSTDWYSGYVPVKQSTPSGSVKYIDIKASTDTYHVYYDETAKVYKVMVNGVAKTLYMNLGTVTTQNISLNIVVNGDGLAGGSPLRKYIKDSNGNIIAKEEYTGVIKQYIDCADANRGLYPVTKDLAYIVQNAKPGWWDATSHDYLLTDCNPDLGWLFACCYIA